jgi:hypothetical protein
MHYVFMAHLPYFGAVFWKIILASYRVEGNAHDDVIPR